MLRASALSKQAWKKSDGALPSLVCGGCPAVDAPILGSAGGSDGPLLLSRGASCCLLAVVTAEDLGDSGGLATGLRWPASPASICKPSSYEGIHWRDVYLLCCRPDVAHHHLQYTQVEGFWTFLMIECCAFCAAKSGSYVLTLCCGGGRGSGDMARSLGTSGLPGLCCTACRDATEPLRHSLLR